MKIEVNFKELRAAVNDLNQSKLLKEAIKLVGVDKDKIYNDFMKAMDKVPDDPKTKQFPTTAPIALAFFNKMVDLEEKGKDTETKDTKKANAKTEKAEKPAKAVKAEKEKKPKAEKSEKKPGVIAKILEIIKTDGPITREDIVKKIVKLFPDRDAKGLEHTVYVQIGGKSSPTRMEKEKNVKFKISSTGEYKLTK